MSAPVTTDRPGAGVAGGTLITRVLTDRAAVDQIVPAWRALAEGSGHAALGFPSWSLACFDRDGGFTRARLRVVTIWSGGELVALGPFAEERHGGLRIVRFLGIWKGQPNRILAAPGYEGAVSAVWAAVRTPRTLLRLDGIDDEVSAAALVAGGRWTSRTTWRSMCVTVDTTEPLDDYLHGDRTGLRQSLRRGRRRIDGDGITFGLLVTNQGSDLADLIPHVRAVELAADNTARWQGLLGQLVAGRLPYALERAAADHLVQALVLMADGQPFAYTLNLVGSGVVTGLLLGHDPAYGRYSPGHLCIAELYRWAHERSLSLDLSVGDFEYKHRWENGSYGITNTVAAPSRALLAAASGAGVLRDRLNGWRWRARRRYRSQGVPV